MKARSSLLLLVLALLIAAGSAYAAQPKLYKWVDKDGVTHYGSSIPPEYASQASEQIDSQGNIVKSTAAQKTPEQIAAEQKAQQQAAAQAQADAVQQANDKVLLDTYTSTKDIERDRDSKLASIDAQINVFNGSIGSLQSTLADLQGRSAELANSNKPVPAKLQQQIEGTKTQLVANQQGLLQEQQHKQQVAAQYAADIARFKQLSAAPASATHQ